MHQTVNRKRWTNWPESSLEYPRWFPQDQRHQGPSKFQHQLAEQLYGDQSDAKISLGSGVYLTQASSDPNKHPARNRAGRHASHLPMSSGLGLLLSCGIRFFLRLFKHVIGVLQSMNDQTLVHSPNTWKIRPRTSRVTLSFGNVDEDDRSQDLVQFRLGRESRKR